MIYFAADAHVGNHRRFAGKTESGLNERCRAALDVLERAAARAREERSPLVLLGDTFDTARPEPQIIAAVQRALRGVECYAMLGNHEQVSTAKGDHALGPLDSHDLIQVVEGPALLTAADVDLLFVPFRPGRADDWLADAIDEAADASCQYYSTPKGRNRVLCLHLGIRDDSTPPWLRDSPGSVDARALARMMEERRIDAVIAGDWHSRRRWLIAGREVMQCGSLCPTGFDNEGLNGYGTLARFDPQAEAGARLSFDELPGPRFVKLRPGDALATPPEGYRLYVQVVAPADQLAVCGDQLREAVEAGTIAAGEVVPDQAQAQEAAREAAEEARGEDTLDGALAAFVGRMELPDEGARARVLERCRRYLATEGG